MAVILLWLCPIDICCYQSAVLSDISAMFSGLVNDTHWLVHQQAFQSVKAFAEVLGFIQTLKFKIINPVDFIEGVFKKFIEIQ